MRRILKIAIISVIGVTGTVFGLLAYSLWFPWLVTVDNVNCEDIKVPIYRIVGIPLVTFQDGKNPISAGNQSTFTIPNLFFGVQVVMDGSTANMIKTHAVVANIYTTSESELDASKIASFQVDDTEVVGHSAVVFNLDKTTKIRVACVQEPTLI